MYTLTEQQYGTTLHPSLFYCWNLYFPSLNRHELFCVVLWIIYIQKYWSLSSLVFFFFYLFSCSGLQRKTLSLQCVISSLPWSDGMDYQEATAYTTWICLTCSLHCVQTVVLSCPVSPVPLRGPLAAGPPTAKELLTDHRHRHQASRLRNPGAGLPTGCRWSNTTLRRNKRSPTTSPPFSSSITRQQCVCVSVAVPFH